MKKLANLSNYAARDEYFDAKSNVDMNAKAIKRKHNITDEQLSGMKKMLSTFIPQEVLLKTFNGDRGKEILYALFADEILSSYFSQEGRRIRYSDGRDANDFVNDLMIGAHTVVEEVQTESGKQEIEKIDVKGGVLSIVDPKSLYVYEPTIRGSKPTECPDCGVSFWQASSGNGSKEFKTMKGDNSAPISEWREDKEDAPDYLKVDVANKRYNFCGGKVEIARVAAGTDENVIAQVASNAFGTIVTYDELVRQNRIRPIDKFIYIIDEKLPALETKFNTDNAFAGMKSTDSKFSADWVITEGDKVYRQCRHPVTLTSPNSVVRTRIKTYQPKVIGTGKQKIVTRYRCPVCEMGGFTDEEGLTTGKNTQTSVRCDHCGTDFDITDEKVVSISLPWIPRKHRNVSLSQTIKSNEDEDFSLADVTPGKDNVAENVHSKLSVNNILSIIEETGKGINVKGSENTRGIFEDIYINGMDSREVMDKYFKGIYALHYTECLDCGHIEEEVANPSSDQLARYKAGQPVKMLRCPNRKTDAHHTDVAMEPKITKDRRIEDAKEIEVEEEEEVVEETRDVGSMEQTPVDPNKGLKEINVIDDIGGDDDTIEVEEGDVEGEEGTEHTAAGGFKKIKDPRFVKKEVPGDVRVEEDFQSITNEYDRNRKMGTNLVYHGSKGEDADDVERNVSWLVKVNDAISGTVGKSEMLSAGDPRSYPGTAVITSHIYQPVRRLITEVLNRLRDNQKIYSQYSDYIIYMNDVIEKQSSLEPGKVSLSRLKAKINKVYAKIKIREKDKE